LSDFSLILQYGGVPEGESLHFKVAYKTQFLFLKMKIDQLIPSC
jgi:hypothetical protein